MNIKTAIVSLVVITVITSFCADYRAYPARPVPGRLQH